jgi:ABC-type transport system involved in multi-copper enzyme maturation permease subunit
MAGNFSLALVTFKGGVRDRLLLGVFVVALLLFFTMPLFSSFSMRDVFGVAVTYSLSLISATGVLLTIFIGGSLVARDIQSRTIYSVATLPISRSRYLLEKYVGLALSLVCSLGILGILNYCGLWFMAAKYPPDKAVLWGNYLFYLLFDLEKLLLLAAILVFFSAIATSSLLPMFLTLAVYAVGMTTEKVKYFIETVKGGRDIDPVVKLVTKSAYYLFPNLSPFDLKLQMVYALPIDYATAALTFCYGIGYIIVTLVLACVIFARRDFV